MNYKISVLLNFLGMLFWMWGFAMLHFFGHDGDYVFVVLLSFGTVSMLVGIVLCVVELLTEHKRKRK